MNKGITSKLVLERLADAVSQLILIISESDINNTPIPDLSKLALAVASQIENLANVARKAESKGDTILRDRMPVACQQVSEASALLLSSASLLLESPMSATGKQQLLEAVKGILSGTGNVLETFDDYESRKIVHQVHLCKETLLKLETTIELNAMERLAQLVIQTSQQILKRTKEIVSSEVSERLEKQVAEITNEIPILITSENSSSFYSQSVKRLKIGFDELIHLLNMQEPDHIATDNTTLLNSRVKLTELKDCISEKVVDSLEITSELQQFNSLATCFLKNVDEKLESLEFPLEKLEKKYQDMTILLSSINGLNDLQTNDKKQEFLDKLNQFSLIAYETNKLLNQTTLSSLMDSLLPNGSFDKLIANLNYFGNSFAVSNPVLAKKISKIQQRLENLVDSLVESRDLNNESPLKQNLTLVWESELAQINTLITENIIAPSNDVLEASKIQTCNALYRIQNSQQPSTELIQQFKLVANNYLKLDQSSENASILAETLEKTNESSIQQVMDSINNCIAYFDELTPKQTIPTSPFGTLFNLVEAIEPAEGVIHERKPLLLSEQEAKKEPIKAVAQEIKVEAYKWAPNGNPIISAARQISASLQTLSDFHSLLSSGNPESKMGFIKAAQSILSTTSQFMKDAGKIVVLCKDKRLSNQIQLSVTQLSTFSQQLKILAAVKASNPTDDDKDQQLIASATNLMIHIKACLSQCESASLRIDDPYEFVFCRAVYRKSR